MILFTINETTQDKYSYCTNRMIIDDDDKGVIIYLKHIVGSKDRYNIERIADEHDHPLRSLEHSKMLIEGLQKLLKKYNVKTTHQAILDQVRDCKIRNQIDDRVSRKCIDIIEILIAFIILLIIIWYLSYQIWQV